MFLHSCVTVSVHAQMAYVGGQQTLTLAPIWLIIGLPTSNLNWQACSRDSPERTP